MLWCSLPLYLTCSIWKIFYRLFFLFYLSCWCKNAWLNTKIVVSKKLVISMTIFEDKFSLTVGNRDKLCYFRSLMFLNYFRIFMNLPFHTFNQRIPFQSPIPRYFLFLLSHLLSWAKKVVSKTSTPFNKLSDS